MNLNIDSYVKEILAGTIFLIVLVFIFRNGGKDFTNIVNASTEAYTKVVGTFINAK